MGARSSDLREGSGAYQINHNCNLDSRAEVARATNVAVVGMNLSSRDYVDALYEQFLQDPSSVPVEWRTYFSSFPDAPVGNSSSVGSGFEAGASQNSAAVGGAGNTASAVTSQTGSPMSLAQLQDRVDQLIRGFRVRGHMAARIDPLGLPRPEQRELIPESYGLLPSDMDKLFSTRTIDGENVRPLGEIVQQMRNTYCRYIGAQFMHIDDYDVRDWLQKRMEGTENRLELSRETQVRILTRLTDAVIFEEFVRRKFVGAKTFSLEGAESLIPLLDLALEEAGNEGIREVVIGMAHRGRLNVLANILGRRAQNIFWGFDDPNPEEHRGGGDVLYHMGYSTDWTTGAGKNVHLSLCFNPSHLEFVNPVAVGRARSKQDRILDTERRQVMPILIHGDAAFAGEGVVQETLNLSELGGYSVGGALHVIVNNQIGFTTIANEGRSTTYASDVAKMLQIPIFHVNGEDPESVAQVIQLAMEFRNEFRRDVVIDMYCYRRLGHNESDEPRFTQPLMYQTIDNKPTVRDSYLERLHKMEGITEEEAVAIAERRKAELQSEFDAAQNDPYTPDTQTMAGYWRGYEGGPEPKEESETGVPIGKLSFLIDQLATVPEDFHLNKKLGRLFSQRREMGEGKRPIDWATAELAAFASLSVDGHRVRLSGQDCGRGTFSQRHAILHDIENGCRHHTLSNLSDDQAVVEIINSPLSEAGVLGFEYGYSLDCPEGLVLWEAQFGDFWNVAQVIVDQFITSAEDKWHRLSGITMLLPHGFEGAGPEHCSARVERFLMLSAEHNIQVVNPTSAAQYFHVLRRQVRRNWRKPLIVLTPKSMLREPAAMSALEELSDGKFHRVIPDEGLLGGNQPERVILATGKIAIELIKLRDEQQRDDVAVIRVEQLYPLPVEEIKAALAPLPDGHPVYWVQEEPANMGAWQFMKVNFGDKLFDRWPLIPITREESASPSTGSKKTHKLEQQEIWDRALAEKKQPVAS